MLEKVFQGSGTKKQKGAAIPILDKIDFRQKLIRRQKSFYTHYSNNPSRRY